MRAGLQHRASILVQPIMTTTLQLAAMMMVIVVATSPCFGMMEIEIVTKERAKELGMEIRANAAGPEAVRVWLEFDVKGGLKDYGRVDLEMREGEKLLLSSTLREEKGAAPGRVVVSFAADRTSLEKVTVRVVTQSAPRSMVGHELRVKDFVDLTKVR